MTPEEFEQGIVNWERACDAAADERNTKYTGDRPPAAEGPPDAHEYLGLTREEFDAWLKKRRLRIAIGHDVDTVDEQNVHVVLGVGHFDKHPLCGADTLWGYHDGTLDDVTCPECLRRAK